MFTAEGKYNVTITQVIFAEPKFETVPNAFDVCVEVQSKDDPAVKDWWRGEWSTKLGVGNVSDKMQWELTLSTLQRCGFQGEDLSTLPAQLVGKGTTATVKSSTSNGRTFYNVRYLGDSDFSPAAINPAEALRRASMIVGGAPQQAAPVQAAPAAAQVQSPFPTASGPAPF